MESRNRESSVDKNSYNRIQVVGGEETEEISHKFSVIMAALVDRIIALP